MNWYEWTIFLLLIFIAVLAKTLLFEPKEKGKLLLTFFTNQIKIKGEITMVSIKSTQEQDFQIEGVDRKGNPAPLEAGSAVFESSDPGVFEVVQNPDDQTKGTVKAIGVGVAQLNFSADADLGEGVETITGFSSGSYRVRSENRNNS
jgi:hypothetical protein